MARRFVRAPFHRAGWVYEVANTDLRRWHLRLRINRVLRVVRSEIRRAGWFN